MWCDFPQTRFNHPEWLKCYIYSIRSYGPPGIRWSHVMTNHSTGIHGCYLFICNTQTDLTYAAVVNEMIDHVFYINLEYRTDRRKSIESLISAIGLQDVSERVPGVVHDKIPFIGCSTAHVNALKMALERGYENTLILEDD